MDDHRMLTTPTLNDGGPAFPYTEANGCNDGGPGMSLRDHFAGKAMQPYLLQSGRGSQREVATLSYQMADAMLKARGVSSNG
jgi:hypothetical protein